MKNLLKHKKILIFLLVLIAAIVFFAFRGKKEAPGISVNTMGLSKNSIEEIISVKAPLEGMEKAEVVSPLNYEIVDIKVKEGDIVTKDQILAVLDSEELEKEISNVENQLQLSTLEQQEKQKSQQLEYDKLLLQISETQKTFNQNKELYENEIITEEAFRKIENDLTALKKNLLGYNAVNGKIVLTEAEIKRSEIQKSDLAQKRQDLDKIYIKSPIDGTVTRVNVTLGRYAKDTLAEKSMFVIENLNKLQMKVSISEFDINKISLGQDVEIYSDILGDKFVKGTVSGISPTAEQKDNNNMERVIPVLIEVIEKPEHLIAGVIAKANIKVAKSENVFTVPAGALLQNADQTIKILSVKDDNTIVSIPVTVGLETDLDVEISGEGLTEGMKIVVNPDYTLTDGLIVVPNDNTASTAAN